MGRVRDYLFGCLGQPLGRLKSSVWGTDSHATSADAVS
jgi:hypothetical protein